MGEKGDGWLPAERDRQTMSAVAREKYEQTYADRLTEPAGKERGDPISQEALERMVAAVVKNGVNCVLLVPPTTHERNFYPTPERER